MKWEVKFVDGTASEVDGIEAEDVKVETGFVVFYNSTTVNGRVIAAYRADIVVSIMKEGTRTS